MIETVMQAALDAGEAILEIYARDFEVEFKADALPLTEADQAAHNIIVQALSATPYPVLSEESGGITYEERKEWNTFWLVDPLDGTKEFIKKNDEFTVNIALIDNGVPVMGVVYAPVLRTIYCGMLEVEGGKWNVGGKSIAWKAERCSGKSVDEMVESATPLSSSSIQLPASLKTKPLRVVASRSHCNEETTAFISALEAEYGEVERVSRGSSLKLCMVAEGSADIYPRIAPTMEWDTAAAHAVVSAAGGQVFEYDETVPVSSYVGSASESVGSGKLDVGTLPPTSHLPPSTTEETSHILPPAKGRNALRSLRYNKENLLNPYFVVSALHT